MRKKAKRPREPFIKTGPTMAQVSKHRPGFKWARKRTDPYKPKASESSE